MVYHYEYTKKIVQVYWKLTYGGKMKISFFILAPSLPKSSCELQLHFFALCTGPVGMEFIYVTGSPTSRIS